MTDLARALLALTACLAGWVAALTLMWHVNPMLAAFVKSKFGRTLIALGAGGLAQAGAALVMGDVSTARIVVASTLGGIGAAVALHFKSEAAS